MFLKTRAKNLIALAIIIPVIAITIFSVSANSCGIQHIQIIEDIKKYEQTLDPEFCLDLVYRIDAFNEQCTPQVDILDCG